MMLGSVGPGSGMPVGPAGGALKSIQSETRPCL